MAITGMALLAGQTALCTDADNSQNQSAAGEQIKWQVISGGGAVNGSSTNFKLSGTVGQTAVGTGSSTGYILRHGFWQSFGACDCRPGDANNDGSKNVGDAVYLISYVFKGGAAPTPYVKCSGDANGDCSANVGDAVYMISYVFKGGAPPVNCDTWLSTCGPPLRK
jgi:hypothetical protein